jgi:hypothetical protein
LGDIFVPVMRAPDLTDRERALPPNFGHTKSRVASDLLKSDAAGWIEGEL